jgi:hypothetical protein
MFKFVKTQTLPAISMLLRAISTADKLEFVSTKAMAAALA